MREGEDVGGREVRVVFWLVCLPATHGEGHGIAGPGAGRVGDVGGRVMF